MLSNLRKGLSDRTGIQIQISGLCAFASSVLPTPCNLFQINYALLPSLLLPGRKLFKVSNMNLGTEKGKTTMSGV